MAAPIVLEPVSYEPTFGAGITYSAGTSGHHTFEASSCLVSIHVSEEVAYFSVIQTPVGGRVACDLLGGGLHQREAAADDTNATGFPFPFHFEGQLQAISVAQSSIPVEGLCLVEPGITGRCSFRVEGRCASCVEYEGVLLCLTAMLLRVIRRRFRAAGVKELIARLLDGCRAYIQVFYNSSKAGFTAFPFLSDELVEAVVTTRGLTGDEWKQGFEF